ncbi:beta-galactosidase, partial [Genlisea aurea]
QIENEYGNVAYAYGNSGKTYTEWAASMAVSLDTGVPWVMCQQSDAPDPIINTCNGFYCDQFTPNSDSKPKMWTENWTGWFSSFGNALPYRPVEDIAFAVARFYQRGGTFQNYYMYHGGTNFGRTTGGPFISTSYDYDAPIDEYGFAREPKWSHLRDLHKALKLCEEALIATDPQISSPGTNLEAAVYKTDAGQCSAFLANVGTESSATVNFNGNSYDLPAWSVSILPDCKSVAFNTAQINAAATLTPRFVQQSTGLDWRWINEPVGISTGGAAVTKPGLLEQINTTADQSDYLWYSTSVEMKGGSQGTLHVDSLGHVLYAFVNGRLAGSGKGGSSNSRVTLEVPVSLVVGTNQIDLLSVTVGLQNYGPFFDQTGAGITGPVQLKGLQDGSTIDLSSQQWTYQIGLKGEALGLSDGSSALWTSQPDLPKKQPLVWYKTTFDAPSGSSPVALDFTGMGKGQAWVNGQGIGRYWPTYIAGSTGCTDSCNYRGSYNSNKCLKNCGKPTQQLYHVPRYWLRPTGNTLVLIEETGGDPTKLSLVTRETGSSSSSSNNICGLASETITPAGGGFLSIACPSPNQVISKIIFASFGTPQGSCGSFSHGQCHSRRTHSIIEKACVGSRSCSVEVSASLFREPCSNSSSNGTTTRSLAVEASCS